MFHVSSRACAGNPYRRRAFTLVELLVVIAIIGVLVSLLLPAVQSARESARRVHCFNNLRQLSVATHNFQQQNRILPPYFGKYPEKGVRAADGSWFIHLLPYIEKHSIHDAIVESGGSYGQTKTLVQPASPDYSPSQTIYPPEGHWETIPGSEDEGTSHNGHTFPRTTPPSRRWVGPPPIVIPGTGTGPIYETTYNGMDNVGNVGLPMLICLSDPSSVGPKQKVKFRFGPDWSLTNYQGNFHVFAKDGVQNKPQRFEEITDGLSNTIMFAEGMRFCDATYRLAFWSSRAFQHSHNFGVDWNGVPNTFMFQSVPHHKKCNNWRVQGLHHGQLAAAFCDGSVRTIPRHISRRETSDPDNPEWGVDPVIGSGEGVWDRLMTIADGDVVGDF